MLDVSPDSTCSSFVGHETSKTPSAPDSAGSHHLAPSATDKITTSYFTAGTVDPKDLCNPKGLITSNAPKKPSHPSAPGALLHKRDLTSGFYSREMDPQPEEEKFIIDVAPPRLPATKKSFGANGFDANGFDANGFHTSDFAPPPLSNTAADLPMIDLGHLPQHAQGQSDATPALDCLYEPNEENDYDHSMQVRSLQPPYPDNDGLPDLDSALNDPWGSIHSKQDRIEKCEQIENSRGADRANEMNLVLTAPSSPVMTAMSPPYSPELMDTKISMEDDFDFDPISSHLSFNSHTSTPGSPEPFDDINAHAATLHKRLEKFQESQVASPPVDPPEGEQNPYKRLFEAFKASKQNQEAWEKWSTASRKKNHLMFIRLKVPKIAKAPNHRYFLRSRAPQRYLTSERRNVTLASSQPRPEPVESPAGDTRH